MVHHFRSSCVALGCLENSFNTCVAILGWCWLLHLFLVIFGTERSYMLTFSHLICRSYWGWCWVWLFLESGSWVLAWLNIQPIARFVPGIWLLQRPWSLLYPVVQFFFQISLCLIKSYLGKTLSSNLCIFGFERIVFDILIDILVAFFWIKWLRLFILVDYRALCLLLCRNLATIFSVKFS